MSHFTVLIIGSNVDDQLAPFQENNMGDCPAKYMAFEDDQDNLENEFKTESSTVFVRNNQEISYREYRGLSQEEQDACAEVDVPHVKQYKDLDDFIKDYHGMTKENNYHNGRWGYWENPNSKWDWFMVGGRWSGYFKLKNGSPGIMGDKSWASVEPEEGYVDQLLKKDLDLDGMLQDAANKADSEYDKTLELYGGEFPVLEHTWEEVRDGEDYKSYDVQKKIDIYHAQHAKIIEKEKKMAYREAAEKAGKDPYDSGLLWHEIENFQCTREEFIERRKNQQLPTFAVIKDGEWYEKGTMGWWSITTDEKSASDWNAEFMKMFKDIPDNEMITVVDCHI